MFFFPKWTWKSYEFSNTLLRRRRGENFRRGSCACFSNVSTQETTCKFKCFHQELKDCFAPEARKKIAFKPLHSEKPKKNLKKNQTKIMHFRNRGRPPQRGSARQFFGNHFHSILRRRAVHFHRELFFSWKKVSNEKHKELVHKKLSSKKKELNFLRENLN